MYRLMGLAHAGLYRTYRTLSAERGQGTVEYVALIMLVAAVFAVVVTAGRGAHGREIVDNITGKIQDAINGFGSGGAPAGKK